MIAQQYRRAEKFCRGYVPEKILADFILAVHHCQCARAGI
jgi:hypothetical protein